MSSNITTVDFKKGPPRGHLLQVDGYRGIYRYAREDGFYIRPVVDGRQRLFKLKVTIISKADIERGKLLAQLERYHAGLDKNPFKRSDAWTIADLCDFYLKQGCPMKRKDKLRSSAALKRQQTYVATLLEWPEAKRLPADEMTPEIWNRYHEWRTKNLDRPGKGGDRQVDLEAVTLSGIFRCAILNGSKTGIKTNPMLAGVSRFRNPEKITHCRDHMPRSGDELHLLAKFLFQLPRSQSLGWMLLAESITGQRSHEVVRMRIDAANKETPGYIAGQKLFMFRSLTSKGTAGHVDLTKDELECFHQLKAWHQRRYPKSPWMFPSPADPSVAVSSSSLTHALARITGPLGLPKRTSHGLRAFRVNVLRGRGYEDGRIALMIGQKSQGKLIVGVYGEGLDYKLQWMPGAGGPAWDHFTVPADQRYHQPELAL